MENRINYQIKDLEVRLISLPEKYKDGVYKITEALEIAKALNSDLIEISSTSSPVICKIMDYSKFLYEQKRKDKDNKKKKTSQTKDMGLTPEIGDHDLETKANKCRKFLENGDKVKVTLLFKGRAIVFKERGELTMLKFADLLKDVGIPEALPRLEGKKMFLVLKPK